MMSRALHLFLSLVFLLSYTSSSAQIFEAISPIAVAGDSTDFSIELPPLVSKTKFDPTAAYYKHVLIYGDGNFSFTESGEKGLFQHLYAPTPTTLVPNYTARSYSTGIYSGGTEEPPAQRTGPITPPATGSNTPTEVVDSNRYLKIMRHVQVKPGDPFITVLSVRNPTDITFNGQLFFLHDGQIRTVSKTAATPTTNYSTFKIRENFMYRPDIADVNTYHYSKLGALGNHYKGLILREITNLRPGEEMHFFVDLAGDTLMNDVFDATTMAEMDFGLALGTYSDDNGYPVLTPENLQQELNTIQLAPLVGGIGVQGVQPDSVTTYDVASDTSFTQTDLFSPEVGAPILLDYYVSTASLVKSHDPNFMIMEACACQGPQERYQIFTTVQCENTGFGETTNVYMDIKLPAGVTAQDVVVQPIAYHPFNGPADDITFIELAPDSIRWQLLNFGIEGTPVHGVGDPRTFANVQFNMYSSVQPEALDSIYACIRFDDLSNDPVCTVPVAVSMLSASSENGVLTCEVGSCVDDPGEKSWPWWYWLILILILLILLLIWYLRNRS